MGNDGGVGAIRVCTASANAAHGWHAAHLPECTSTARWEGGTVACATRSPRVRTSDSDRGASAFSAIESAREPEATLGVWAGPPPAATAHAVDCPGHVGCDATSDALALTPR